MRKPFDLALPLRIVVGVMFLTIVVLTLVQVFARYVFNSPLLWSEELARLLLVWVVFLGGAVVCWDGRHLNVDTFFSRTPPKLRAVLRATNALIALFFLFILAWSSWPLIELEWIINMGSIPISMSFVRIPALVGGVLMITFILLRWFYRIPGEKKADPDLDHSKEAM
ncbi:TRAP transporter small permease [Crocinitomicaceae bacterium]|nr:TRAP transporter small permease [Crocinitomicaceae bacterium]